MSKLDQMIISAKTKTTLAIEKAKQSVKDFYTGEQGVSNVVATIIILLIVVLIIGVFWNRLSEWLNGIMDTIFGTEVKTKSDKEL